MPIRFYSLVHMPYLGLSSNDEIKMNNVCIWNFDKKKNDYIANIQLKDKAKKIIKLYKDNIRTVNNIGIISIGNTDFRKFNRKEFDEIRMMRNILFLSCVSKNIYGEHNINSGHNAYTSENFQIVIQNFTLRDDFYAISTGFVIHKTDGGYELGKNKIIKPQHINQPIRFDYDVDLFRELVNLKSNNKALLGRIMKATNIFFESYFNSDDVNVNARILLQTSALEILLDLPEKGQRKCLKDKIENYCNNKNDRKRRFGYMIYSTKHYESRSIKGVWADRFYSLRNDIIHGNKFKDEDYLFRKSQHHFFIATKIFIFLIKSLINESVPTGNTKIFYDRIDWKEWVVRHTDPPTKAEGFVVSQDTAALLLDRM